MNNADPVVQELMKERERRLVQLANNDPVYCRLQGAIDFALGRWGLKGEESNEVSEGEANREVEG